jgi:hypothetical protein
VAGRLTLWQVRAEKMMMMMMMMMWCLDSSEELANSSDSAK